MNLPLNIDWQQILLHIFNLVILVGGLYFILYKPVKKFMDKRTEQYRKMDEDAKAKLAEADKLYNEYENRLAQAGEEIAAKKSQAVKDAAVIGEYEIAKAKEQAKKIIADAHRDATHDRDKIMAAAGKEIEAIAAVAAEKVLKEKADAVYEQFLSAAKEQDNEK